jgi:hypothetical protein
LIANQNIKDFTKLNSRLSKKLSERMKIDIEFLRSHNLMDYSLLLGIETTNVKILPTSLSEPPFSFADYARTVKTSILLK